MTVKLIRFINEDLWQIEESKLPLLPAFAVRALKIAYLSVQGFTRDLCPLRASALTLYSILSIVPIIAMLFGIAKGFGFETVLEQRLLEQAPPQDSMVLQLISFAQNLLDSTKGGMVAGIGIVVLFWTVINVIGNIEESFNAIWKIAKGRSFSRKFSDYLSLMLLAPIILIASGSITVFLNTQITWLIKIIQLPDAGTWLVLKLLGLSPLVLMIALFSFTLIFMPNHKISYRAGIIAGIVTGLLYHASQLAYLSLQLGASNYNAIYGSFAALPLFVVWLQIGWMIVLFGAQIAFFIQNYELHRNNNRYCGLSLALKKVIALQITHLIVHNFIAPNKALTATDIANRLLMPIAIIQPVLMTLLASQIIAEFRVAEQDEAIYQPAVDSHALTIAYVISAIDYNGHYLLPDISHQQPFLAAVEHFRALMEASDHNRLLIDL